MNRVRLDPHETLALLDAWYEGDRDALGRLLLAIEPWLLSEISRTLSSLPRKSQDTADVLNTSIANFLTWGPRFRPRSIAQFCALLRRIAINEIIDMQRRADTHRIVECDARASVAHPYSGYGPLAPTTFDPEHSIGRRDEREWVRTALQFLSPDDRYLLIASEVEGCTWAEIGRALGGRSAESVRMRAKRVKPQLANYMRMLKRGRTPEPD